MTPQKAKAVLNNNEVWDIAELADAIQEDKRQQSKPKHIPSRARSQDAYAHKKLREAQLAEFRERLKKVWPK